MIIIKAVLNSTTDSQTTKQVRGDERIKQTRFQHAKKFRTLHATELLNISG